MWGGRARTPRSVASALRWTLAACAVLLFATSAMRAPHAEAHALAISSEPAPNSKLTESPKQIDIVFNEPIEPSVSTIALWNQQGDQVALGDSHFFDDPKRMAVDVPVTLEPGIYTVIWRNLSQVDAHTWQGSFPFTVLGANGEEPTGAAAAIDIGGGGSDLPSLLDTTARWSVLVAISVIFGGISLALGVARPALRRIDDDVARRTWDVSRSALLLSGVIAGLLVVQGTLLQLALKAQDFGGLDAAKTVLLDTRFGNYLTARLGLAAVTLACFAIAWRLGDRRGARVALWAAFAGSAGLLLTHSLVSHAASGDGAVTAVAIDALHLAAAAFWLGALMHVIFTLPRWLELLQSGPRTVFLARLFARFSGAATISVALLLASGVLSATLQAPTWSSLYDSNWGRSLLAKLGLTLLLLAAAGANAYLLRPRVVDAAEEEGQLDSGMLTALHRRFLNLMRVEVTAGVAVLAAAAVLIQLQSPRDSALASAFNAPKGTQEATSDGPFTKTKNAGVLQVYLDIDPAQVGENTFTLGLGTEFGAVSPVLQARLEFEHEGEGATSSGASRVILPRVSEGEAQPVFKATGSNLSLPGTWRVTANFRFRGEDDLSQEFELTLPGASTASDAPSTGIWNWPFDSRFGIAALVVSVIGVLGVVIVQAGGFRRRDLP